MPRNNYIQVRRGSSVEWIAQNSVLGSGEPGFDTTNNILKIGDGVTSWSNLSSIKISSTGVSDFNSAVSGLLPVKNIIAGSGITISANSGNYTINSTSSGSGSVDVYEYATTASFPASGTSAVIYIATDSGKNYRWTGSVYVEFGPVGGGDTSLFSLFAPTAPTNVTGTAADAQVALSWTAPSGTYFPPITDYTIQYSSNSGSTWTTFTDTVSTSTSVTVTGLTNNTAYVFRVAAVNGIGTGSYSSNSPSLTPITGDPLFGYNSLLLHMDGSGSTFADSSKYTRTITAGGSVTQSTTQSKFGGKSAYFNGTSDGLSFPDILLGTGDFTIEMFFKTNSSVQYAQLIGNESSGGFNGYSLLINNNSSTGGQIALYRQGAFILQSSSGDWSDDAWHHIALVRSGTTITLWIDGSSYGTATDSSSYSGDTYYIGRNNIFTPRNMVGYIDEVRISKYARYTSSFTPTTTAFLEAVPGSDVWYPETVALLHFNGSNGSTTFTDSSTTPKSITRVGSPTISTAQYKFGGSSALFNGSSDYLTIADSNLQVGSGDWTIECWIYLLSLQTGIRTLWAHRTDGNAVGGAALTHTNGSIRLYIAGNSASWQTIDFSPGLTFSANSWQHVALVRDGNIIRTFLNGTAGTTTTVTSGLIYTVSNFSLMAGSAAGTQEVNGHIDDFRFTKGFARYTTSFTPTSTAFPDF